MESRVSAAKYTGLCEEGLELKETGRDDENE